MKLDQKRVSTGIEGFDEILHGGLIQGRCYLVVGETGTGKTILSIQWLLDGKKRGEAGLYVTLVEPWREIERDMASFGWDLRGIDVLDLTPTVKFEETAEGEYHVFPPSEVERIPVWQAIYQAVEAKNPRRVVIDSVTLLRYLSTDEYQFRKHILGLVRFLNSKGCTSLLTFEPTDLEGETSVALATDGMIRLRLEISPARVIGLRSLEVEKMRGSDFMTGLHPLRITDSGIKVFPHRIEKPRDVRPGEETLPFGIQQLDRLLGGGLETGTTTVISGPTGVGKSTLGMQFLAHAVANGKKAILYVFEESQQLVLARSRGVGIPIEEMIKSGDLRIVRANPLEFYPDEFLDLLRKAVEKENDKVVMIDSLRGYKMAMEQFGSLVAHIQNMVTYLNNRGVTTLLINEVEHLTGDLVLTEIGISHLADNLILIRYAEYAGKIIRVICCLKKRLGGHLPELWEFSVTPRGIRMERNLEELQGVLTGVPSFKGK